MYAKRTRSKQRARLNCEARICLKLIDKPSNSFTCHPCPESFKFAAPVNPERGLFMSDKPIEEKVKDIIVEQFGVNPEQVTPTASFIEDLGADSLDIVELVMAFEEEFSVEVPDEDAEKLQTVGDVIKYIEERAKQAGADSEASIPCEKHGCGRVFLLPVASRREAATD